LDLAQPTSSSRDKHFITNQHVGRKIRIPQEFRFQPTRVGSLKTAGKIEAVSTRKSPFPAQNKKGEDTFAFF